MVTRFLRDIFGLVGDKYEKQLQIRPCVRNKVVLYYSQVKSLDRSIRSQAANRRRYTSLIPYSGEVCGFG